MKLLILLIPFLFLSCNSEKKSPVSDNVEVKYGHGNSGHRLGSDVIKKYRQNSLELLEASIEMGIFKHKSFKYWEFDVRETKDGILIVHHDRGLKSGQKIDKITYEQLKSYQSDIPTYFEIMDVLKTTPGRIAVEIKSIISDKGRMSLISKFNEVKSHKEEWVRLLSFPKKFKKSFPKKDRKKWCKQMGLVMQARRHKKDLCK